MDSADCPVLHWVGLGWGRDTGSVFLDPWDHELYPTRVPLYLAPHWWFHIWAISLQDFCSLGKAAVEWFSGEIIRPKWQLSASTYILRSQARLLGWRYWRTRRLPQSAAVILGLLVQEAWGYLAHMTFQRNLALRTGLWDKLSDAKDFGFPSSKPWIPQNLGIFLGGNVCIQQICTDWSREVG